MLDDIFITFIVHLYEKLFIENMKRSYRNHKPDVHKGKMLHDFYDKPIFIMFW